MQRTILVLILFCLFIPVTNAASLKGSVTDKSNKEPLIGATIQIAGTANGVITDVNGIFDFGNLKAGSYSLEVKYVGYQSLLIKEVKITGKEPNVIQIEMTPESQALGEVTVVAQAKKSTEAALLTLTKNSLLVQSGISAQQIKRTQDRDASEVIRRIPGISIIDDKFVMVRGLSQRYNNVWINGSSVPSSEPDSRAFSFDIIPSSQLDNMMIVKSPSPEYPADFSGGFILIQTKDVPTSNTFSISLGSNYNDKTHGKEFLYSKGSSTDFLGFDNGFRMINGGIGGALKGIDGTGTDLLNNGFNNDWILNSRKPLADLNFNTNMSRYWEFNGHKLALMTALNYSNNYKSFLNMENSLFGAYDKTNDKSNYLRHSTDNQYNYNVRIGGMLNLTYIPGNGNNRYEFKNIFNQLGKSRYTERTGTNAQNDKEQSAEYFYSSRTTYNGQITGTHTVGGNKWIWNAGYAYANRNIPDRRRYTLNDKLEMGTIGLTSGNDINREFTKLDEHILSAGLNYERPFKLGEFAPTVKAGIFGEYRTRKYTTRNFIYNWNNSRNTLPENFRYLNIPEELSDESNFGVDKLYLFEEVKWRNNYKGNNRLGAGYVSANLPLGKFNVYAGVRFEYNKMELIGNTRDYEKSEQSTFYTNKDLFPSINTVYKLNDKQQLRLSYGKSVNRAEFREVSSSVFYDFDLASDVQGNTELKPCYVNNIDFRYEWYPSRGEQISIAAFYKKFNQPIEWTYTVAGGTNLIYSYRNAKGANNYGLEVDIRKNLDFIGLPCFSFNFNGSLIHSRVNFEAGSREKNRPMQGQSPYLINTGIFYNSSKDNFSFGILYNRIGKRIIGVGRSVGTTGGDDTAIIPNSYEMPRNAIDLSASCKFSKHWEVKAGIRDLLAEKVTFEQMTDAMHSNGTRSIVKEVTKQYSPGRNINLNISYNF